MSEVLAEFVDDPSDALQIAVRGQHIERWKRPRDESSHSLGEQHTPSGVNALR